MCVPDDVIDVRLLRGMPDREGMQGVSQCLVHSTAHIPLWSSRNPSRSTCGTAYSWPRQCRDCDEEEHAEDPTERLDGLALHDAALFFSAARAFFLA